MDELINQCCLYTSRNNIYINKYTIYIQSNELFQLNFTNKPLFNNFIIKDRMYLIISYINNKTAVISILSGKMLENNHFQDVKFIYHEFVDDFKYAYFIDIINTHYTYDILNHDDANNNLKIFKLICVIQYNKLLINYL